MKYYLLRDSSDKKIIGVNDGGAQAMLLGEKWNKEELERYENEYLFGIWETVAKIRKGEKITPPKLEYLELRRKALLTDFLTYSDAYAGGDHLISKKVEKILSNHNVNCRIYHDVGLYQSGKSIDGYSNLHLIPLDSKNVVNFPESICFNGSELAGKTYRYPKSYEEFIKINQEGRLLKFESVNLNWEIVGNLDLFCLDLAVSNIFISERLKTSFNNGEVSGLNILECTEPNLV